MFKNKTRLAPPPETLFILNKSNYINAIGHIKRNNGFTLAEVLITLGIIGVVAALTLPSLIQHFKDQAIVAQTKKSYSNFLNVLNLMKANEGGTDYATIFKENETPISITQEFAQYYNGAKICTSQNSGCGSRYTAKLAFATNNGLGGIARETIGYPRLLLPDGSLIYLRDLRNGCEPYTYTAQIKDSNGFYTGETAVLTDTRCATVVIDANGSNKGPNQYGADIHQILIYPTNIGIRDNNFSALKSIFTNNKLRYEKYPDNKTFDR